MHLMAAALGLSNRFVFLAPWRTGFNKRGRTWVEKWGLNDVWGSKCHCKATHTNEELKSPFLSMALALLPGRAEQMEATQGLQKCQVQTFFFFFATNRTPNHTLMLSKLSICLMIWKFVQSPHSPLANQEQHHYLLLQLPIKLALITTCRWTSPSHQRLFLIKSTLSSSALLAKNNKHT